MKFAIHRHGDRFGRRASGMLLVLMVLLACAALLSAMGCGKYGSPRRISQTKDASVSSTALETPAPDIDDAIDEEDEEPEGVKP